MLEGACHCGAVTASLSTDIPPDSLEVRACQCSFCASRGVKTVSDPNGKLRLQIGGAYAYRFGMRTADFWICKTCGAYMAATIQDEGRCFGVLNVAGARIIALAERVAIPVRYDSEDSNARIDRRKARWTPAELVN